MKNKSRFILIAFCFYAFAKAYSQQSPASLLTKQEAIAQMLENNYGVRIAENQKLIAENNKGILNSGYLPTVNGTAGANYEQTDTEVDFGGALNQDGSVRDNVNIQDAETRRYNAAINVNYTLFDGLGRLYNYKRLKELYNLSELQARQTIETNALQLMSVYLEVARIRENVQVLEQALDISLKREQRAQYQFDYGQVNKLEVLNARVDINTDSINLLNAQQQLRNAKRDLNLIMQRDIETSFAVDTTVTLLNELEIVSFIEKASENNVRLLQADRNVTVSEYDIKTARSLMLPRIGLTGSYGWNQTDNPASAFFPSTTNLSTSLQLGANLTWDIFDGGTSITNYRNAQIRFKNEELLKKQIGDEVKRDIANARGNYNNALRIYQMQEQNLITNQNNFTRTEERYKLGQVSSVEFRQAQVNLLNAQTTKNLAKYDAKLAELQLLQLTGQLLNVEL
ncbi:TolC family protein [Nonlabens tegetincola]|uniref:TolC family protein n=1 Tax=Nonlabens tegetincola TaxID=323273 RepID=UPI000CF43E41|nr:TolC family protein [Nonlabens tegetincola]PQJ13946.1 transporter [Nonlabens tegetincola]